MPGRRARLRGQAATSTTTTAHLGPDAPINSLGEEIADNQANEHEALKFGNGTHAAAFAIDISPLSPASIAYRNDLPMGKSLATPGIDRMMTNDTPGRPERRLHRDPRHRRQGPRAGYPQLTIPMGYNATQRRTLNVSVHANAYKERDLIGVAYVIEQATKKRQPASEVNPSHVSLREDRPGAAVRRARLLQPGLRVGADARRRRGDDAAVLAGDRVRHVAAGAAGRGHADVGDADQGVPDADRADQRRRPGAAGRAVAEPATRWPRRRRSTASARPAARAARCTACPVLLDDTIDAQGLPTTGGSIALQNSTAGRRRRARGQAQGGRARSSSARPTSPSWTASSTPTCPRATHRSAARSCCRPTRTRPPAGSSAGSAASTAAGLAALTIGLETSTDRRSSSRRRASRASSASSRRSASCLRPACCRWPSRRTRPARSPARWPTPRPRSRR